MKILPNFWGWGGGGGGGGGVGFFLGFFSPKKRKYVTKYSSLFYCFKPHLCKISYKKIWMHLACDCSYLSKQIKIFLSSSIWDIESNKSLKREPIKVGTYLSASLIYFILINWGYLIHKSNSCFFFSFFFLQWANCKILSKVRVLCPLVQLFTFQRGGHWAKTYGI
jgi:hypothetical protein